ncbi:HAMP domain-containing histidine kinase [Clostridium sp. SHJSY1]|uniref:sensor histidine kinase n=1 Tax=Clostridium sp. SHJSY1 TaxID=2942483 RepID=UPI0028766995|nr:HAMP domain-containing sensor histidine kinase [Clostridium sp. SHJSY1]MDS0526848.1 HAMP domain-containing histidine kinase [Clostridium sp. SHJSY1]
MDSLRFYRNPEARKVTFKFIIILITGTISIGLGTFTITKNISKTLLNQNAVILSNILEGKKDNDIIKNFYRKRSIEEINKSKEILSSYGYDENITLSSDEIVEGIFKNMLLMFIPIQVVFLVILYLCFTKELKRIYIKIDEIVRSTGAMSNGEYREIDGDYKEGEMALLISSLNYMGDRVNNSIELLRYDKEKLKDFLSDISHQLKTPLSSLVMFNDLLRENENMPHEDKIKFLDKSEEQLRRMEWLIMNLLKVGRIEANAIKFEKEKQPLEETIELAISSLLEEARKKEQNLVVEGEIQAKVIHDKEWLAEALSNIIKNSIEHTDKGGEIKVEVYRGPLITKIYIKDNGIGMSEELQKKVFKRFYKGENSSNPKSIGIGLSLSKSIVEEMDGEIKLISEEGKGSTFIISFFNSEK